VDLALALEEACDVAVEDSDFALEMTVAQVRALVAGTGGPQQGQARDGGQRTAAPPEWPYRWGRIFRFLDLPFRLAYRFVVTRTAVLGTEHLEGLPERVIFAGNHHGFADLLLVRHALERCGQRRLVARLITAAGAGRFASAGALAWIGVLAFGLYPLRQHSDRETSLRRLVGLVESGNALLLFPQGVHAKLAEEEMNAPRVRFRTGVAYLAQALDAVVVPFGVAGTEAIIPPEIDAWRGPKIGGIPISVHRGPLAIAFGAPLRPEKDELPAEFAARLQSVCYGLAARARAALADGSGSG
jgi:1-acyl-sn-glycerol-3-phosphate acyltransferase